MPRALVAGAAGFIGSHLSERLLNDGLQVIGVDNYITGDTKNIVNLLRHPNFEFLEANLIDPVSIEGKIDEVYHLASPASPIAYYANPFATLYSGSDVTRNLLEVCRAKGARFLLTSTSEVYGDPTEHPQTESYWGNVNPVGPRSVYDEGKRFAEALTMAYHRYHAVSTRIARLFNTYGPRMAMADGRVIPAFTCQCLRGEALTVFGDGSQTRSFCYVTDTVDGIVRLMRSDLHRPCNIGNPNEMTVEALAKLLVDKIGTSSTITYHPLPEDDPKRRRPDITLAKQALGWEPRIALEEGLAKTAEYFREILNSDSNAPQKPTTVKKAAPDPES
jgi:dTDP-glucose 4,6-dehydratase